MDVGIDFGTTNSALAVAGPDGEVRLAEFGAFPGVTTTFRSILYADPRRRDAERRPLLLAGPAAIDAYLTAETRSRLIQSLKTYLSSRLFTATSIDGATFTIEDLIAILVRAIRAGAEERFGAIGSRVVVGRPVRFSGSEGPDDDRFAEGRLRSAFQSAGFEEIVFELEPVAAAAHYATRLTSAQLVLIADFGGGTSDFSLVRLGRDGERPASEVLGADGVGIGGDVFDARIVGRLVSPALGRGTEYRGMNRQMHPVPSWIYGSLERWHHLSFLNNRQTLHMLETIRAQALEKAAIEALIHVIEQNMGYGISRAVEGAKHALTSAPESLLRFDDPPVLIERPLARASFESWIEADLETIDRCVSGLLDSCGAVPADVDRVFMTGGSSLVPAVRRRFEERFGQGRMHGGGELTSVAEGLALRAREVFAGR